MRRDRGSLGVAPVLIVIGAAAVALLVVVTTTELWAGVTITVTALLGVVLTREVMTRISVDRALTRATTALKELSTGTDGAGRSVPELLDALTARVRELVTARWCTVALTDDTGALRLESTSGESPFAVGEARDGHDIPRERTTHHLAVPLAIGDSRLGVVEVGAAPPRRFTRADHELLRILADHLATTIERARLVDAERRSSLGSTHARAHLTLLADISVILARALEDPTPALAESAHIIAGTIADACAIHLTTDNGTLQAAAIANFPVLDFDTPTGAPYDEFVRRFPSTTDSLRRVMETGRSELSYVRADGRVQGAHDNMATALQMAGMMSWVVAPVRVRGLAVGTIVVATGAQRRGLRVSDQRTVDQIANRMAIVIERAQLYQDSRRAAVAAERRATQLSDLVEATIAFNRSLQTGELLHALVEQTSRVLGSDHARAWLTAESGPEAEFGRRAPDALRVGSSLVDADGNAVGYLSVERGSDRPFSGDEEALLLLLARLASVALQNARLYDALRVREERLSTLFAASPLAIVELDLNGHVREVNPAARTLFGVGHDTDVQVPPELRSRLNGLIAHSIEHGVADTEATVPIGDEVFELWVSAAPLRRPRGTPIGALLVISDITARKRLEEQLIEAHRFEAIAQLAGGVAHDFNNLLTIIVGYSELALRAGAPSDLHDELTAINEAGQLAAVITNQLLMLSRRQILKPVVVSLVSACTSIVPMLRRLVGDRVTIEAEFAADAPVKIDQGQLEQILFNLVLNSRDAMAGHGTITIRTALVDDADRVSLVVSDTGGGMDEETLARCLQPFFTTKGRRGIGLGLATVSSIVDRVGGRLAIESQLGKGTTISVGFPVVVEGALSEVEAAPHRSARVAVVDDDELIRRWVEQVLGEAGYDVVTFSDAESALSWLDGGHTADLLVSDVVLPGMSGFELMGAVGRRHPTTAKLLMTGFAATDAPDIDLSAVAVLSKPFSIEEFLKAVSSSLEQDAPAPDQGSKR